jgi:hypothetical protein
MAKQVKRNRAAEAIARGNRLCMFEISAATDAAIERTREHLAAVEGRCTRVQALERLIREGAKRLLAVSAVRFVYLARSEHGEYKIGQSGDPVKRARTLSRNNPFPVMLLHQIETTHAGWLESYLKRKFRIQRIRGEWFKFKAADVRFITALDTQSVDALVEDYRRNRVKS